MFGTLNSKKHFKRLHASYSLIFLSRIPTTWTTNWIYSEWMYIVLKPSREFFNKIERNQMQKSLKFDKSKIDFRTCRLIINGTDQSWSCEINSWIQVRFNKESNVQNYPRRHRWYSGLVSKWMSLSTTAWITVVFGFWPVNILSVGLTNKLNVTQDDVGFP